MTTLAQRDLLLIARDNLRDVERGLQKLTGDIESGEFWDGGNLQGTVHSQGLVERLKEISASARKAAGAIANSGILKGGS